MKTVLQIGEGNFLRAFADYFLQLANEKNIYPCRVALCQPRSNTAVVNALKNQNCKYNIVIRGKDGGRLVNEVKEVNCIYRCIDTVGEYSNLVEVFKDSSLSAVISNTTEAGICFNPDDKLTDSPQVSFPAKVTALLYERYKAGRDGVVFFPVELIENNGDCLKACVEKYIKLWNLDCGFLNYVKNDCFFCNTLVDRIVTGHIEYENDACAVACEPYASWLIEANGRVKTLLPFDKIDKRISYVDGLKEYRSRKVRILNGAHTMSVPAAFLMGFDIVRDMMQDSLMNSFVRKGIFEQVIPTVNLPEEELRAFAESVFERFENPFIDHRLLDISLNSVSKFKTRCLCSLLDYKELTGDLPDVLCFGLAALISFYNGRYLDGKLFGVRNGESYEIRDCAEVLDFFEKEYKGNDVVKAVLSNKNFWDIDLTEVDGLYDLVLEYFTCINTYGMRKAVCRVVYGG